MAQLFVPPRAGAAFVDGQGHVYPGGLLNFYQTGTTTRLNTYADSGLVTPNANPVVADANGLFSSIYLSDNTLYKVVFTTSAGATVWTVDPLEGPPLSTTPAVGLLRSYLAGLGMSRNVGTPNTKIDVAAGACADDTNVLAMSVTAGTIDTGTVGVNGLDAGVLVLSTWYHAFVIAKVDGTTGLLLSTSASSPAMPSGYTLKRRIGSVKTDASVHFLAFIQDGDLFQWLAVTGVTSNNPGISAVSRTADVPTGINVIANLQIIIVNTSAGGVAVGVLSDLATTDTAPVSTTYGDTPGTIQASGSSQNNAGRISVRTNTSGQYRARLSFSDASTNLNINTLGWTDRRGRDA